MKITFLLFLIVWSVAHHTHGQNAFPTFNESALVSPNGSADSFNKPYTILIYGGIHCGYSEFLIKNLPLLDTCKSLANVVLLMQEPADSIKKYMSNTLLLYPTFTNTTLNYRLTKKNDVVPQTLVFRNKKQIYHIMGVKEEMLTKIKKIVFDEKAK